MDEMLESTSRPGLRDFGTDIGQQRSKMREMKTRLREKLQRHQNGLKDLDISVVDQPYEDISQAPNLVEPYEEDHNEKEDELIVLEFKLEGLEAKLGSTTGSAEDFVRPWPFKSRQIARVSLQIFVPRVLKWK